MGDANSRIPSSACSTGPRRPTIAGLNDGATACSTNISPNNGPYTATRVNGQSSSSCRNDGTAYKNKNNKTDHGNHQDHDGTSDIHGSKDNAEPHQTSLTNTVSHSEYPVQRSDGSTVQHDDHGHNDNHDHYRRHQLRDDVGTSSKDEP